MNSRIYSSLLISILLLTIWGCSTAPTVRGQVAKAPLITAAPSATKPPEAPAEPGAPVTQSNRSMANTTMVSAVQPEALALRVLLSHLAYGSTAPTQLLLKVQFSSPDNRPPNRPPLNLALVLDRSSSMGADMKFSHAIAAARAVIENLSEQDTVSLVAFNERSLVLSPAGRVVNKPFLFQRLSEVSPDGITDLSAGLLEGFAQISSQNAEGQVKHVLLLTDGQANTGVTDPAALRKIVEAAHAKGIGVSTLGCGTDFNEKVLTDLATAGGGRYTYVKSSEQLPSAFREELRGLLEVVAQNVRLEISVNQGGAISKVYGQPWPQASPRFDLPIGNLRAGERGFVMLALKPSDFKQGAAIEVAAKLTYDSPETSERITRAVTTRAEFSAAEGTIEVNEEVTLCAAVMDAMDLAADALQDFNLDRYAKARASFDQWHGRVRQFALANRNQDLLNEAFLLKHFMEELQAIRGPDAPPLLSDTRSQIEKQSNYQNYQLLHRQVTQAK